MARPLDSTGTTERSPVGEDRGAVGPAPGSCTLRVGGMDCASCAANVEKALRGVDGVRDVRADVVSGKVVVSYAGEAVSRTALADAVERVGYRVEGGEPSQRAVFVVRGMDCADEVRLIEGVLAGRGDVDRLDFDLMRQRLTVEGRIPPAAVERAVASVGLEARPLGAAREEPSWWQRHGRLVLAALSGVFWALALVAGPLLGRETLAALFAVAAVVAGGQYVVPRGVRAALNGALDMNFLMSVAAVGALIIGEYTEAASAMFLFAVAQLLESRSMDRARNAISALMDLSPAEATVLRDGREVRVPAEAVAVGEVVVVRPGEKIPVDGVVVRGRSGVNQAPITGESLPVDKTPDAEVFAGTLNGEGVLELRSTRPAADTTLARIIHAVEEAQASRAPSQRFVDRFARVYTPAVVAGAALVALVPPLAGLGAWGEWVYRALVLLVVACPCALVISTPVTIVSALAGSARRGILVKGGLHLETAGRARALAVDKTGTLTSGEPEVVDVVGLNGVSPGEVLRWAAAAERRSDHPIARAVVRHAEARGIDVPVAEEASAMTGLGVRARVAGREVVVGSERLFARLGLVDDGMRAALDRQEREGRTAVLVATGAHRAAGNDGAVLVGLIAVADRVRPEAARALAGLHEAGIEHIVMLTGDNAGTARAVARALGGPGVGVDEVRAELLPDDKVRAVRELRDHYRTVLFVGDGINDAPALAAADVGVAMGSAGTDVALETADIALMADDLSRLPVAIRSARKAERIIRWNIGFSLATKAVFVALGALGIATLWMAVLADMGTSLLVVMNGMRALRA